jgi:hypothetical protein
MRDVLVALRASLADVLTLVVGTPAGAEADLIKIIAAVDATQRQAALDDAVIVGRIRGALAVEAFWRVRLILAFGTQARVNASSPQIPALSNGAAHRADAHLAAGEANDAVTTVVTSLTDRRRIDSSTVKDIVFVAGAAADATTTFPSFAPDAKGRFVPTAKPTIQVGPPALVNTSVLVSALLREAARAVRESRPSTTDPTSAGATSIQAVETVLYEIEHRAAAGIGRHGSRMHELGRAADRRVRRARRRGTQAVPDPVPAGQGRGDGDRGHRGTRFDPVADRHHQRRARHDPRRGPRPSSARSRVPPRPPVARSGRTTTSSTGSPPR